MTRLATLLALAAFSLIAQGVVKYVLSPASDASPQAPASAQLAPASEASGGVGFEP